MSLRRVFGGLCAFLALAIWGAANEARAENFVIDDYRVQIVVDKSKTARVTEIIDARFTTPSHGILREIPAPNAEISDISAHGEPCEISREGGGATLRLGDPERLVSGAKRYTISYAYRYLDDKNEFYHNIIGTSWRTSIARASFEVTLPQAVSDEDVGLSIGRAGTRGFAGGASYRVAGERVSGEITRALAPGEGVTLRVSVREGYFERPFALAPYLGGAALVIFTLGAYLTWRRHGKDKRVIPVVSFRPPAGMNALLAQAVYAGKADNKGLAALLVELAAKGYLRIEEGEGKDDFTLTKLRDFEGLGKSEREFLDAIFGGSNLNNSNLNPGENAAPKETVRSAELAASKEYYSACYRLKLDAKEEANELLYESESLSTRLRLRMLVFIAGIAAVAILALTGFRAWVFVDHPEVAIIAAFVAVVVISAKSLGEVPLIWALGCAGIIVAILGAEGCFSGEYLPLVAASAACGAVAIVCAARLPKYSERGRRALGELQGLRKYIETAEKRELEALGAQNPRYFYDILPYALILGVSDVWIGKVAEFLRAHPIETGSDFVFLGAESFSHSMDMVSRASVANGGISAGGGASGRGEHSSSGGGGGRSGGGGGGGGGGSW